MRSFFLCILFSHFISLTGFSQSLPNGSFENWKPSLDVDQPVGWFTSSIFTPDPPRPVVKTTDKQDGEFALHLETVKTMVGGSEQIVQGIAVTGKIDLTNGPIVGFPLKGRPAKLRFYYKYQPLFNDSMAIIVSILKEGYPEPIGVAGFTTPESVTQYRMLDLTITYYSEEEPDSASISIFSGQDTVRPGSLLIVDNMSFIYDNTGFENDEFGGQFGSPYPNPVRNETWFPISLNNPGKVTLHVSDINGKTVALQENVLGSGEAGMRFDTEGLKPGIYLYRLSTFGSTATGKLVVAE